MFSLSPEKYSTVYLNFKEIKPWIVPDSYREQLNETALFIKHNHELTKAKPSKALLSRSYREKISGTLSEDELLHFLGVASKGNLASPFVSLKEWNEWIDKSDLNLLTEKFYHPPSYLLAGAGRHALTPNAHLKGIGRNILSTGEDYSHSWGGLLVRDALKGYLTGLYVSERTLLPQMANFGLFLYSQTDDDGVPLVLQIRDSSTFRLSQTYSACLLEEEKEVIRSHLVHFFKTSDPSHMLDRIIEHYVHAYSVGVKHKSLAPDNLLIDGRWIDTESLDFNLDGEAFDEWVTVGVVGKEFDLNVVKNSSMLDMQEDFIFLDSWVHQLHLMVKSTVMAYQGLWEPLNYPLEAKFRHFLDRHFGKLDLSYWLGLLDQFQSISGIKFGIMPKARNQRFPVDHENLFTLKLRGYFFNSEWPLHNLTFGRSETDSYEEMQRLTQKWEKAFWPQQLNWRAAHQQAQQISRMVHGQ